MIIALDYDETYTADPKLWEIFVSSAKNKGHEVIFVTYRYEPDDGFDIQNADIKEAAKKLGIEIVFTCGQQKAGCVCADIWIDDMPLTIPVANDLRDMHKGCLANGDVKGNMEEEK